MTSSATMDYARYDRVRAVSWRDDALLLLDQRKLPFVQEEIRCETAAAVAQAIRDLVVRGAPAIGIAAAWGVVLASQCVVANVGEEARKSLSATLAELNGARPTAVNLAWALRRMSLCLSRSGQDWREQLLAEAQAIETEDLAANHRMGGSGAALIAPGSAVLTHCNTGSLATAGFGTALGVIRAGVAEGRIDKVFAGETRPWLQGARLTLWELMQDGIDVTLIADSAAAHLMASGKLQWVIVGADRICANGDVANKIGTYGLAILARHHGVRFMVVAPASTIDLATGSGDLIDIEQRDAAELLNLGGIATAAPGGKAWNPVFDITPANLIDAIVTEHGVVLDPDAAKMNSAFGRPA
ncbi:MAG: S-methyl-5-thioribose-1-phosphate isomerase [Pseudomarimonas sp.]